MIIQNEIKKISKKKKTKSKKFKLIIVKQWRTHNFKLQSLKKAKRCSNIMVILTILFEKMEMEASIGDAKKYTSRISTAAQP